MICSDVLKLAKGTGQHQIVNEVRHDASGAEILRNRVSFEQQPRRLDVVLCETENAEVGSFQLSTEFLDPDDAWFHMGRDEDVQAFAQDIQQKGLQPQRGGSAAFSRPTDKNSFRVQFNMSVYRDCPASLLSSTTRSAFAPAVSICSYSSANSGFDDADFRPLHCWSSSRQAALKSPLNRFQPSSGIIFTRTRPANRSADAARLVADLLAHGVV